MAEKKLDCDPLVRAESIMAHESGERGNMIVERREQVRDLLLLSQAQSLKRLADAVGGGLFTAPINSYGEGIGEAIQGQFVRGMNGVDQYEHLRNK